MLSLHVLAADAASGNNNLLGLAAILAAVDLAGIAAVIAAVGAIVLGIIARPRAGSPPPSAGDQDTDALIMRQLARENGQLDTRNRALEAAMLRAGLDPREVP